MEAIDLLFKPAPGAESLAEVQQLWLLPPDAPGLQGLDASLAAILEELRSVNGQPAGALQLRVSYNGLARALPAVSLQRLVAANVGLINSFDEEHFEFDAQRLVVRYAFMAPVQVRRCHR